MKNIKLTIQGNSINCKLSSDNELYSSVRLFESSKYIAPSENDEPFDPFYVTSIFDLINMVKAVKIEYQKKV